MLFPIILINFKFLRLPIECGNDVNPQFNKTKSFNDVSEPNDSGNPSNLQSHKTNCSKLVNLDKSPKLSIFSNTTLIVRVSASNMSKLTFVSNKC